VSIAPAFERPTTNPAHEIVAGKTSTEIPGWKNRIDGINNNSGHLWSKLEGNNDLLLARSKRPPQVLNLVPGKSEMSELAKSKIHLESALQDSQVCTVLFSFISASHGYHYSAKNSIV